MYYIRTCVLKMNPEEDFLSNYQNNIFQDVPNDPYKSATIKRKCLAQTYVACSNLSNDDLVCDILDDKLQELSDLVDDKSNINNYASNIESITTKSNTTTTEFKWKHQLNLDDYKSLITSLNCCSTIKPSTDELKQFFTVSVDVVDTEEVSTKKQCFPVNVVNTEETSSKRNIGCFKTARDELNVQNVKKYGSNNSKQPAYGVQKKSLGSRRNVQSKFIPPLLSNEEQSPSNKSSQNSEEEFVDVRLKNIEPRMIELIRSEIMDSSAPISWDDIAGLEFAKTIIKEVVVWPLLRPDIFTGLRRPPKGILLFGPPGTGKTLIGKCIASQSGSTFFSISASSLTSKWIGDGEKMVRALFAVARCHQPAVIFIDEIDSLLSQRSETEHESSRRIKTEFLVQLDGAATEDDDRILVIGATNRPQELDEAARRRFVKRLYIPLPEQSARQQIVERLMSTERNHLTPEDINEIAELSGGYSGADMKNLCAEASLGPIRSIDFNMIQNIQIEQVRSITMDDFRAALNRVRASVSSNDLEQYIKWDKTYGAGGW